MTAALIQRTGLVPGIILKRYKRFLADVETAAGVLTAHCTNTGTMATSWEPGDLVLLEPSPKPGRKLKFTWLACRRGGTWVGVETGMPNRVVAEAARRDRLPGLPGLRDLLRLYERLHLLNPRRIAQDEFGVLLCPLRCLLILPGLRLVGRHQQGNGNRQKRNPKITGHDYSCLLKRAAARARYGLMPCSLAEQLGVYFRCAASGPLGLSAHDVYGMRRNRIYSTLFEAAGWRTYCAGAGAGVALVTVRCSALMASAERSTISTLRL